MFAVLGFGRFGVLWATVGNASKLMEGEGLESELCNDSEEMVPSPKIKGEYALKLQLCCRYVGRPIAVCRSALN
jgi:hypothetical protein